MASCSISDWQRAVDMADHAEDVLGPDILWENPEEFLTYWSMGEVLFPFVPIAVFRDHAVPMPFFVERNPRMAAELLIYNALGMQDD